MFNSAISEGVLLLHMFRRPWINPYHGLDSLLPPQLTYAILPSWHGPPMKVISSMCSAHLICSLICHPCSFVNDAIGTLLRCSVHKFPLLFQEMEKYVDMSTTRIGMGDSPANQTPVYIETH